MKAFLDDKVYKPGLEHYREGKTKAVKKKKKKTAKKRGK